ncbi:MAG: hypothetical protein JRI99_06475 [Deltaproteobacteria bacterium]|nr:hypothetical protein [Deltaproteobacteria bacterium]
MTMIINYFRLIGDSEKALERTEEFLKPWQQGEESFWVDIHSYDTDELEAWLDNLNLSDLAIRCCLEAGQAARFIPLREEVFFECTVYTEGAQSDIVNLAFLCIRNLVITLHPAPIPRLDGVI